MKRIILDTNFLMIPGSLGVDIFSEIDRITDFPYGLFIVDKTLKELKGLTIKGKGKHKRAAWLALQLIEAKRVGTIQTKGNKNVDNLILETAKTSDLVATQDKELKSLLKDKGVNVIVLRKKKYLNIIKT